MKGDDLCKTCPHKDRCLLNQLCLNPLKQRMLIPEVEGPVPMVLMVRKKALLQLLADHPSCEVIPSNATVSIRIPSGGDYSGTRLDFDDSTQIEVRWKK